MNKIRKGLTWQRHRAERQNIMVRNIRYRSIKHFGHYVRLHSGREFHYFIPQCHPTLFSIFDVEF